MPLTIQQVTLDLSRQPFAAPVGFKGGYMTEKWLPRVGLTDSAGATASADAGQAVLWSDAQVFAGHTEVGGNLIETVVLERALQMARGQSFDTPLDLLDRLLEPLYDYARQVSGVDRLRKTFVLNAMIALDSAAWRLLGCRAGAVTFDDLLPAEIRPVLAHRHRQVAHVPLLAYGTSMSETRRLAEGGHFILKIKIGAPGSPKQMLEADARRVQEIHQCVKDLRTPHTKDGRLRYYLDANGRYPDLDTLRRLVEAIDAAGAREQILLLEEPFDEGDEFAVADLGVPVAADESLHDPADVRKRVDLGYRVLALKPMGKTLSMTLLMAAEARRQGIDCFVADSACTPPMLDWNLNVAARLAPMSGLGVGVMEANGPQNYRHWEQMLARHDPASAARLNSRDGLFVLDDEFFSGGGGVVVSEKGAM